MPFTKLMYSLSPEFNANSFAFTGRHSRSFIVTKFSTCLFLYLEDRVLNLDPVCCRVRAALFLLQSYRVVQAWVLQGAK